MAQSMPESVKVTALPRRLLLAASEEHPFQIKLSRDEVMVLLAIDWYWSGDFNVGDNVIAAGLWRKTDTGPPGGIFAGAESEDMLWSRHESALFATELRQSGSHYIALPWPLVLIRAPRFIINTTAITDVYTVMRLYYLIREVKDVDLAKLMVKDHA